MSALTKIFYALAAMFPGFLLFLLGMFITNRWWRAIGVTIALIGMFMMVAGYQFDHDPQFHNEAMWYIRKAAEWWKSLR